MIPNKSVKPLGFPPLDVILASKDEGGYTKPQPMGTHFAI